MGMAGAEGGQRRGWPEVPGYALQSLLGRGGYSAVYAARQLSVNRIVALKVISAGDLDAEVERRFRAEAEAIGNLSWHPHVVVLHDAGFAEDGSPYLAMELMPAGSIGARLKAQGPLPTAEALRVAIEVADALGAAHDARILHRDVKPDNVLVGRRGQAVLSDFGIATLSDGTSSSTTTFAGTYAFSAPELLEGRRATVRTDVYSLGATLYSMLVGRNAYASRGEETPAALMWRIVSGPPDPLPDTVPAVVAAVVSQAMSRDPEVRHGSAAALKRSLEHALAALSADPAPRLRATVPHPPAAPSPTPGTWAPPTPGATPAPTPSPGTWAPPTPGPTPGPASWPAPTPTPGSASTSYPFPPPPPPGATPSGPWPPGPSSTPPAAPAASGDASWSLPTVVALLALAAVVVLVLVLAR
jgi:serine/threonine protein kinase